jgi:hypothetical protein
MYFSNNYNFNKISIDSHNFCQALKQLVSNLTLFTIASSHPRLDFLSLEHYFRKIIKPD